MHVKAESFGSAGRWVVVTPCQEAFASTAHMLCLRVVGVGVVDAGGGDVVQGLTWPCLRLGDVDDLEDLRTAEAGDLHGTHAAKVWPPEHSRSLR